MRVRLAVGIRPEWLLDIAPNELSERDELQWNADRQRVERVSRLLCGAITLEESRQPAPPSVEAARLLCEAALASGQGGQQRGEAPTELQAKLEVLRQAFPEAGVPELGAKAWQAMVGAACEGITSLAELQASPIESHWLASLPAAVARLLREEVPERIRLASGRLVSVHYQTGKLPWIESRLQTFSARPQGRPSARAACRSRCTSWHPTSARCRSPAISATSGASTTPRSGASWAGATRATPGPRTAPAQRPRLRTERASPVRLSGLCAFCGGKS